jgi:hypothetical protein
MFVEKNRCEEKKIFPKFGLFFSSLTSDQAQKDQSH